MQTREEQDRLMEQQRLGGDYEDDGIVERDYDTYEEDNYSLVAARDFEREIYKQCDKEDELNHDTDDEDSDEPQQSNEYTKDEYYYCNKLCICEHVREDHEGYTGFCEAEGCRCPEFKELNNLSNKEILS